MKPIPGLDDLLSRAAGMGIFGTKMRLLITMPGKGIDAVIDQQSAVAQQILDAGRCRSSNPRSTSTVPPGAAAEEQLTSSIIDRLGTLAEGRQMLKPTLPENDGLYSDLVDDPRVMRVLSAVRRATPARKPAMRLSLQPRVIASFPERSPRA